MHRPCQTKDLVKQVVQRLVQKLVRIDIALEGTVGRREPQPLEKLEPFLDELLQF